MSIPTETVPTTISIKISHNGFEYGFTYDAFGKTLTTSVGDRTLMTYSYSAGNGKVLQSNYGNGNSYTNQYDTLGNVVGVRYNGVQQFTWKMNAKGQTIEHEDLSNEKKYYYEYDSTGRTTRTTVFDTQTGERIQEHEYKYDLNNNISKYVSVIDGTPYVTQFEYGKDNLLTKTVLSSNVEITNTYDGLNRLTETELGTQSPKTTTYEYYAPKVSQNGSNTTMQLKSETIDGVKYEYVYDDRGNITEIYKGNTLVSAYEYDELSQLILEYDAVRGTETYYTYDNGGNILNRTVLDAETYELLDDVNYEYGDESWKDLLTEYDGSAITYDQIGNPLSYRGYTMTWQRGRQLATLNGNGVSATYQYDSDGLRNIKTVNGVTHEYYYDGTSLIAEKRGSDMIVWNGAGFILNGTYYYYKTNTRGDVIGLYDANGTQICEYEYDAWGKLLSVTDMEGNAITSATHPANINPIRYRSYYYDTETGLYYLQSRYYDPETGRFINVDNQLLVDNYMTGMNLFAYCGNNPINRIDPGGDAWWHWALGAVVVAACAVATVVTAGGFAAAVGAVAAVGSGFAAATTASTIAAGAFIGSAIAYGTAAVVAASTSRSVKEFNDKGSWKTVATTVGGAVLGGAGGYANTRTPTKKVYRSVSNAEAQNIKTTGQFNLAPGGMESKQFGFDLAETRQFGNMMGQNMIVSAKVPTNMLNQFYTGGVDASIFRSGTLTVYGDQLAAFNQAVDGTIKIMR